MERKYGIGMKCVGNEKGGFGMNTYQVIDAKDAGKKTTTIMEVQDRAVYKRLADALICNPTLMIT